MSDIFNKLCIIRTRGIGPLKYAKMIAEFGNAENAAHSLNLSDEFMDTIKREMDALDKIGGFYVSDGDDDFPKNLKHAYGCTPILSVVGNRAVFDKQMVGMVGTRHASAMGQKIISEIGMRFAENDWCVVSGMAMGSDTAAHIGALRANGDANTIAVLAGGVDYIWPLENERLYFEIKERGAIVSEIPIGNQPIAAQFIQRNKIIAAMSSKLILGESNEGSGSLATVKFATDFNRQIYAIPSHPTDPRSVGPNRLIKSGFAKLCMGADDFFPKLEFGAENLSKTPEKNTSENTILDLIGTVPISESSLAQLSSKNIAEIKRELVLLELQNLIEKVNGGFIKR